MRIAILTSPSSWYLQDLRRAAVDRHTITVCSFAQLTASVGMAGEPAVRTAEWNTNEFDGLLVRSMPPGSLEQVVFRMNALARVESAGTVVMNPPRSLEVAIDKYLTLARLSDAGLDVPPTITCQSCDAAMDAFVRLGGDVVVKPLFGGEGRGIARLEDEALAQRAFKMLEQLGAVIYLQKFIHHEGRDLRVLVLGDRVMAISRHNPHDWRTNVSRGAVTRPAAVDPQIRETARLAARTVGAPFVGVDILVGRDGQSYVLEVNAVPGWRALSRTLHVDVAAMVLEWLEGEVDR